MDKNTRENTTWAWQIGKTNCQLKLKMSLASALQCSVKCAELDSIHASAVTDFTLPTVVLASALLLLSIKQQQFINIPLIICEQYC